MTCRRIALDIFCARALTPPGDRLLDLGGQRDCRRGGFAPERHARRAVLVNLRADVRPDVVADAQALPFRRGSFDAVLCAEVLEHVADPVAVLVEVVRVLTPGGRAVLAAPFLLGEHHDPIDVGRYLPAWWAQTCRAVELGDVEVSPQGSWASVCCDLLHHVGWQRGGLVGRVMVALAARGVGLARWFDARWPVAGVATGYGIVARRAR